MKFINSDLSLLFQKLQSLWRIVKFPFFCLLLLWLGTQAYPKLLEIDRDEFEIWYFLAALIIYQLGILLQPERLRLILNRAGSPKSYYFTLGLNLATIPYYFITPGGVGVEVARFAKLKSQDSEKLKGLTILSILFADRFCGLIGAVLLGLLGWRSLLKLEIAISHPTILLALFACSLILIFLVFQFANYIHSIYLQFIEFQKLFFSKVSLLCICIVYSVLVQATIGIATYLIAVSIGLNIELLTVIWVTAAGTVLIVVPVTVLGFNLSDASAPALYYIGGIGIGDAAILVIIGYLLRLWLGIQGVCFAMYFERQSTTLIHPGKL